MISDTSVIIRIMKLVCIAQRLKCEALAEVVLACHDFLSAFDDKLDHSRDRKSI
jgi:hypothetical protein